MSHLKVPISVFFPLPRFIVIRHRLTASLQQHIRIRKCWTPMCSCASLEIQNVIAHRTIQGNLSCACREQLNLHRTELPAKKPCSIQFRTRIQRTFYTKVSQWKPTFTMSDTVLVFIAAFDSRRRGVCVKFLDTKRDLRNRGKRFYCY